MIAFALFAVKGCFSDNGRTYVLDPISGPGYILSGAELETIEDIPGVLSVGDRNYARAVYVTFYPSTGERIASSPFKRDFAPDFGAVDASKTYLAIVAAMIEVCEIDTKYQYRTGLASNTLKTAKNNGGPAYVLALNCHEERKPYQER